MNAFAAGAGLVLALAGATVQAAPVIPTQPPPVSASAGGSAPEFQVVVGTSITQFAGGHFPSGSSRNGLTAGAALRWPLAPRWSLRTGLAYVERGTVLGSEAYYAFADLPDGVVKLTYELAYVEVPAMIAWSLPARDARITVFAGPALAVKMSEWVHQTGAAEVKVRHNDMLNADALGELGISLETTYAGHNVLAEAIYDEGLVNALRPAAGNDLVRNTGLRVEVGVGWAMRR